MTNGSSQGLLCRPAIQDNSVVEDILGQTGFSGPFSQGLCSATVGEIPVISPIVGLSNRDRPSAVFSRVRAVIINSIQRMSVRAFSHIGQKVLKEVPPGINGDSPVRVAVTIPNSSTHRGPGSPGGGARLSVFSSVGVADLDVSTEASARFCVPANQVSGRNLTLFPAVTSAIPVADRRTVLIPRWGRPNHGKPTEYMSGQVFSVVRTPRHLARVSGNRRWSFWP